MFFNDSSLKAGGLAAWPKEIQPELSIQNSDLYQADFSYCNGEQYSPMNEEMNVYQFLITPTMIVRFLILIYRKKNTYFS
jgi:hypothetical protein